MKRVWTIAALLLTAVVLVGGAASAANIERIGTAGAQELRIPVGTRGIALAGATVASNHGIEAIYYNPAGLGSTLGSEALFSDTEYFADMKVRYFALASKQSIGVIGVTAKILDVGKLYVTTEEAPEGTGEVESITYATLGLSYARYLTDAISFGATGNFLSESVLHTRATGVCFDLGLHYDAGWHNSRFGLVMKNVGPNMTFSGSDLEYILHLPGDDPGASPRTVTSEAASFELPSYFQMGGEIRAWQAGDNSITAYGAFQSNNFSQDEWRGGAEFGFKDLLMVRGGYAYSSQKDYLYGPTFGLGLAVPMGSSKITFDYAMQTVDSWFDNLHTFSAKVSF
jgi:hypothetical protein